jgi:hypothetical protein
VPSQQLQGQLLIQHGVDTSNYFIEQYNLKSKTNYRQALEKKKHLNAKKVNKDDDDDDYFIDTNRSNY